MAAGSGAGCTVKCRVVNHDSQRSRRQSPSGLGGRLAHIGQLIDGGSLSEAQQALEQTPGEPAELVDLMRLKLKVALREIEPTTALQRVIALLGRSPGNAAALQVYRELSLVEYQQGRSCPSFSHPPPRR